VAVAGDMVTKLNRAGNHWQEIKLWWIMRRTKIIHAAFLIQAVENKNLIKMFKRTAYIVVSVAAAV
jgi:hypothetical protein